MTMDEARATIKRAVDQAGPYSHNLCSIVLSMVHQWHGLAAANALVEEYGLEDLYGIRKIEGLGQPPKGCSSP